jgi:putative ABC transport system permease protein
LLLLVAAGLMVKSYSRLIAVDPGFQIDHIVTADIALPSMTYADSSRQVQFWDNVVARLRSSPGVVATAAVSNVPLCQCNATAGFAVVGAPTPLPGQSPEASYHTIVPGYFATLGIPIRRGRDIDSHDGVNGHRVIVVNQAFVAQFLAGRDPLSTQLAIDTFGPIAIVGVVGNTHHFGLDQPAPAEMYVPSAEYASRFMTLVVRTAGDPRTAIPALRAAVAAVDPNQPLARVITMDEAAKVSTFLQSLALELLAAFAIVATLLSGLGIYGVISFSVGQRTREMGIRAALGAQPVELLRLIVGQGVVPVSIGVGIGLVAAALSTGAMSALLYGVSPTDVPTFAAVTAALVAVGVIASLVPARRAARVDPVVALRSE